MTLNTEADDDKQAQIDFESGMADDAPPDRAVTEAAQQDTKTVPKTEVKPVEKPAEPKYVQITEEQFARLDAAAQKTVALEGQLSKAFGTLGNLDQIVKKLQTATPAGMSVTIPKDAFADMARDFPDLAAQMQAGLEKALAGVSGTGSSSTIDHDAIAKQISERVRERTQAAQAEELADVYPNWRVIVGAPDNDGKQDANNPFRKWLKTQTPDYQTTVNNTNSGAVIMRAIGRFEKSQTKTPPAPVVDPKAVRSARIAAAVRPSGDGGQPASNRNASDEFAEGFKSG